MKFKKYILFASIILVITNSIAQNPHIDSLENLLYENKAKDTIRINLLNEIAYKLYQIDVNKTYQYADVAEQLSDSLNYPNGKAESIRLKGIFYLLRGNYAMALESFQLSLEIAQKIKNQYLISKAYNNIGLVYGFYEDYDKELEFYKKSLLIAEEIGDIEGKSISISNIALVYKTTGNYDEALKYLNRALEIDYELGDIAGIARAYNNISTIYIEQKRFEKATEFYKKSLLLSEETGAKSTEAESYYGLAVIYNSEGKHDIAYSVCKKAFQIADEIEELKLIAESAELLSQISSQKGLFKEAYKFHVIFKTMNDSLYNEENTKKIAGLELQYQYERVKNALELEQKKKDLEREAEKKQQSNIRNILIIGFIVIVLILIFVWVNLLQKRKANKILEYQKKEIQSINTELNSTNESLNKSLKTVNLQKKEIENNQKNIRASINYASRIQKALLPAEEFFSTNFNSHFILYKPKDIVSGDFYFFKKIEDHIIIATADCTGHGIPGAFVSMLGIAFLNEIVRKTEVSSAAEILEELREQVKTTLKDNSNKDGMDVAVCVINSKTKQMQFSGANSPVYIFRNTELIKLPATPNPIGIHYDNEKSFDNFDYQLQKEDIIYMFTDGIIDQFGGEKDKKFMFNRFHELLKSVQSEPLKRQKILLNGSIEKWKGKNRPQTDDILLMGIKI